MSWLKLSRGATFPQRLGRSGLGSFALVRFPGKSLDLVAPPPFARRPSDIIKARATLEKGHLAGDEFSSAFFTFSLGKRCFEESKQVVQRQAQDVLADGNFEKIQEAMQAMQLEVLTTTNDIAQSEAWLGKIPEVSSKFPYSWNQWSNLRLEEMQDNIGECMWSMAQVIEHAAATATTKIFDGCRPHMVILDNLLAQRERSSGLSQEVWEEVRVLSMSAWNLRRGLAGFRCALVAACESMTKLLADLGTKKGLQDNFMETLEVLRETVEAPQTWCDMLWALLKGLEAFDGIMSKSTLLGAGVESSPNILAKFELGMKCGIPQSDPSLSDTQRDDLVRSTPLLCLVAALYTYQKRIREEPQMPGESWRVKMSALPEDGLVEQCVDWLETSVLATIVHDEIWSPLRDGCFQFVLEDLKIMSASTVEDEDASGTIDENFLSLLVGADLVAMAGTAKAHLNHTGSGVVAAGGSQSKALPHVQRCIAFSHMLSLTSRGQVLASGWQHTPNEAKLLSDDGDGGLCKWVLTTFSSMHTVMLWAALVQNFLWGAARSELFQPFKPGAKASGTANDPTGVFGMVSATALDAMSNLKAALAKFSTELSSPVADAQQLAPYNLVRPLSFCRQWCSQVGSFLRGSQVEFACAASNFMKDFASDLESATPRWDALFPSRQAVDWTLVNSRILQHAKRPLVGPMARALKAVKNVVESRLQEWGGGGAPPASTPPSITTPRTR